MCVGKDLDAAGAILIPGHFRPPTTLKIRFNALRT